jgi:hypothetical protein
MCTVLLPPDINPITVNKYIILNFLQYIWAYIFKKLSYFDIEMLLGVK